MSDVPAAKRVLPNVWLPKYANTSSTASSMILRNAFPTMLSGENESRWNDRILVCATTPRAIITHHMDLMKGKPSSEHDDWPQPIYKDDFNSGQIKLSVPRWF